MISWRNTNPFRFFNDRSWASRWNKPSLVGGIPQMSRKNILPKKQTKSHWKMMLGRLTLLLNMVPSSGCYILVTGKTYTNISWNFHHTNPSVSSYKNPAATFPTKSLRQIFDMYARVEDSGGGEPFTPRKVTKHWSTLVNLTGREFVPLVFGDQSLVMLNYVLKDPDMP